MTHAANHEVIYRSAYELYRRNTPWESFFRQILGREGMVRRELGTPESRSEFEHSETSAKIHQMLTKLREQQAKKSPPKESTNSNGSAAPQQLQEGQEPTKVITIRLPKSMHEALRNEAHEHKTSMNQLCISKLLQFIDAELVPSETPREE